MNRRLLLIAENIENSLGFVDVGTDHGYLPVYMAQNGYSGKIYASDINLDPLKKAIKHAADNGLEDRISFSLADGLHSCPKDEIDTIVIAGMGGDMILKILDETEWCMSDKYKLILQPMSKSEVLRYWLVYNEFEINTEILVDENNTIYQIIVARFGGNTKLNDAELFIGKKDLAADAELYRKQFENYKKRFTRAISDMSNSATAPQHRVQLFKEIYQQLEEMES